MPNIPMKPVFQLNPGTQICAKLAIDKNKVAHWKYARECPSNFSPLLPGAVMEIFELNKVAPVWVKAYLPNTHKTAYLKLSGEELSWNFLLVQ